jgi:hypothetical protein
MMIYTAKLSRKKAALAILILGLLCTGLILLISGHPQVPEQEPLRLCTPQDCVTHLTSLGWEVVPEPVETLQFLLPKVLEEPYLSYNALQLTQGFDLSTCCGKQLTRLTFTVTNYPDRPNNVQANLYLCEEQLVAGDILCSGENGFQVALTYPKPTAES